MTDALGRATLYTLNASSQIIGIKRPTSSSDDVTIAYDANGRVQTVTRDGQSWTYAWSLSGTTLTATVTDPLSHQRLTTANTSQHVLLTDKDALGHTTTYTPDTNGRITRITYPEGNYDQLTYDTRGNVTSKTSVSKTPGTPANIVLTASYDTTCTINYTYDALNQVTRKNGAATDTTYTHDLLGHRTNAVFTASNQGTTWGYDALGRVTYENGTLRSGQLTSKTMQYDLDGHLTKLTWPDGFYFSYLYDTLGEMTYIGDGTGSVRVSYIYDDYGRRTIRNFDQYTNVVYGYDTWSRLTSLQLSNSGQGGTFTLGDYSPAGEIRSRGQTNDVFTWSQGVNVNRGYTSDALNRYTTVAGSSVGYDALGNIASLGGTTYSYSAENMLLSVASGGTTTTLAYDPLNRLFYSSASGGTQFDYLGGQLIAEYDSSNTLLRRYLYGADADEPLIWYEGTGTTNRRYLDADERGSIARITDANGNTLATNTYDEYGVPASTNMGRFQYTGQAWLPEASLYTYKARMYSPTLGRFMQTDPIGYADGPNWYNYVGSDPVNAVDPWGLFPIGTLQPEDQPVGPADPNPITVTGKTDPNPITVTGKRQFFLDVTISSVRNAFASPATGNSNEHGGTSGGKLTQKDDGPEIVVTAKKPNKNCLGSAVASNIASLGFDAGGVALALAAPEAKLAQLGVAAGGIVAGAFSGDLPGLGIGITGYHTIPLDGQLLSKAGNFIVKGVGWATGVGAVLNDLNNIRTEYNQCSNGG